MATVIDSLVVLLGLDPKQHTTGTKKVEDDQKKLRNETARTAKEMEARGKQAAEFFSNVRREVVGLFAAFTAGVGLEQFISQTIEADAATGRLAKNLDMSTEALSAWQGVLRRNGGTSADADSGLQTIAKAQQDILLTGNSALIPYFNLLKVRMTDLKDPSATLLKIADAFHGMDPKRAAALGQSMGFSPAMISLLEKGRTAVQAMLDEQKKIGVVSEENAAAAMRLQNTLSSLKQSFTSIGRAILTAFAPALDVAAKVMTFLAELAQRNKPIIVGMFLGVAAAATLAAIPLALVAAEALAFAAPFILAGAAIGAVVEVIILIVRWLGNLIGHSQQVQSAWAELSDAAREVGSAFADAFAPLQPMFHEVAEAARSIGGAISSAFGGASRAVAESFLNWITGALHAMTRSLRALAALLRGDWRGALAAVGAGDAPAASPAARPTAAPTPSRGSSAGAVAANLIAGFEGFLSHAKWDRNAFRAGFGSDTTTDARTGRVSKITSSSTVSKEDAVADLQRRVQTEFMPKVAAAVGAAWNRFSDASKAALTSIAYNYGRLPRDVLAAARRGDTAAVAAAIKARGSDNGGINYRRRLAEAAIVGQQTQAANSNVPSSVAALRPTASAQYARPQANDNRSSSKDVSAGDTIHTEIGVVHIYTRSTDPKGIAAELTGPAMAQRSYVTQANSGLS